MNAPSSDWSLTDRTTWITLLTVVAAVLSDVFHRSFAAYVPAAATVAAGLVVAGVALAKHHYRAALASARLTAISAAPQLPPAAADVVQPFMSAAAQVADALTTAGASIAAAAQPAPAPATAAQSVQPVSTPVPAAQAPVTGAQAAPPAVS